MLSQQPSVSKLPHPQYAPSQFKSSDSNDEASFTLGNFAQLVKPTPFRNSPKLDPIITNTAGLSPVPLVSVFSEPDSPGIDSVVVSKPTLTKANSNLAELPLRRCETPDLSPKRGPVHRGVSLLRRSETSGGPVRRCETPDASPYRGILKSAFESRFRNKTNYMRSLSRNSSGKSTKVKIIENKSEDVLMMKKKEVQTPTKKGKKK